MCSEIYQFKNFYHIANLRLIYVDSFYTKRIELLYLNCSFSWIKWFESFFMKTLFVLLHFFLAKLSKIYFVDEKWCFWFLYDIFYITNICLDLFFEIYFEQFGVRQTQALEFHPSISLPLYFLSTFNEKCQTILLALYAKPNHDGYHRSIDNY